MPRIHCTKCGECCKGFSDDKSVILFPCDFDIIPKKINMRVQDFKKKYCNLTQLETEIKTINIYTLKHTQSECVFLDDNICKIFDHRPIQCQRAPFRFFWNGVLDYQYECLQKVSIPSEWSSEKYDKELLSSLFNQSK